MATSLAALTRAERVSWCGQELGKLLRCDSDAQGRGSRKGDWDGIPRHEHIKEGCRLLRDAPEWHEALVRGLSGVMTSERRDVAVYVAPTGPGRGLVLEIRRWGAPLGEVELLLFQLIALELLPLLAPDAQVLGHSPPREAELLALIVSGASEGDMCAHWGISKHTLRKHVQSLYRRFGVQGRAELLNIRAIRETFAVPFESQAVPGLPHLTARQREIVRRAADGASEKEIAAEFGLSPHTVHDALKLVHRKLGVRSRAELVALVQSDRVPDDPGPRLRHEMPSTCAPSPACSSKESMDFWLSPRRSLSVRRVGDLLLLASGNQATITDEEWAPFVQHILAHYRTRMPDCVLLYSPTQMISKVQRAEWVEAFHASDTGHMCRCALVTRSRRVRAIAAFVRWTRRASTELRAFAPGLERKALGWLAERTSFDVDGALRLLSEDVENLVAANVESHEGEAPGIHLR